jgi:hypothetical protein
VSCLLPMLRDASLRDAPQHEVVVFQQIKPQPEEPRACAASRRMGSNTDFLIPGTG